MQKPPVRRTSERTGRVTGSLMKRTIILTRSMRSMTTQTGRRGTKMSDIPSAAYHLSLFSQRRNQSSVLDNHDLTAGY